VYRYYTYQTNGICREAKCLTPAPMLALSPSLFMGHPSTSFQLTRNTSFVHVKVRVVIYFHTKLKTYTFKVKWYCDLNVWADLFVNLNPTLKMRRHLTDFECLKNVWSLTDFEFEVRHIPRQEWPHDRWELSSSSTTMLSMPAKYWHVKPWHQSEMCCLSARNTYTICLVIYRREKQPSVWQQRAWVWEDAERCSVEHQPPTVHLWPTTATLNSGLMCLYQEIGMLICLHGQ